MSHWIAEHINEISGGIGATGTILLDSVNSSFEDKFIHTILYDGNIVFMWIVIIILKGTLGAFVGVFVGNWVAKHSKNKEQ